MMESVGMDLPIPGSFFRSATDELLYTVKSHYRNAKLLHLLSFTAVGGFPFIQDNRIFVKETDWITFSQTHQLTPVQKEMLALHAN